MATTLPSGVVQPTQSEQTSSKKAVSLIDSLLNTPTLAQGTSITPTLQNVQSNELLSTPGVTGTIAAATPQAVAPTAATSATGTAQQVSTVTQPGAAQFNAATLFNSAVLN